jgi:hypothetical protein
MALSRRVVQLGGQGAGGEQGCAGVADHYVGASQQVMCRALTAMPLPPAIGVRSLTTTLPTNGITIDRFGARFTIGTPATLRLATMVEPTVDIWP